MKLYLGPVSNRRELDINDAFDIALTYAFIDFQDPLNQKSDFSKTIKLPPTDRNITELNPYLSDPSLGVIGESLIEECIIYDGANILIEGNFKVLKVAYSGQRPTEIEVVIFGNRFSIFSEMGDKKINDPSMELAKYAHQITFPDIEDANLDNSVTFEGLSITVPVASPDYPFLLRGYKYPMVDFGGSVGMAAPTDPVVLGARWSINDFKPQMYLRELIERLIWSNGYTLASGGFFDEAENADISELLWFNPKAFQESGVTIYGLTEVEHNLGTSANKFNGTVDSFTSGFRVLMDFTTTSGPDFDPVTDIFTAAIDGTYTSTFVWDSDMMLEKQTTSSEQITNMGLKMDMLFFVERVSDGALMTSINYSIDQFTGQATGNTAGSLAEFNIARASLSMPPFYAAAGEDFKLYFSLSKAEVTTISLIGIPSTSDWFGFIRTNNLTAPRVAEWNIQEGGGLEKYIGDYFQRDVMNMFIKTFDVLMTCDNDNKIVHLDGYDQFFDFDLENTFDLTDKIDANTLVITPEGLRNQVGFPQITAVQGSGFYPQLYADRNDFVYGSKAISFSDKWNKNKKKDEVLWQSIPLYEKRYLANPSGNEYRYIVAQLTKDSLETNELTQTDESDKRSGGPSLMYFKVMRIAGADPVPDKAIYIIDTDGTTVLGDIVDSSGDSAFYYGGHINLRDDLLNDYGAVDDVNFGVPKEIYLADSLTTWTNKNTFNRFFVNRFYQLMSPSSAVAEVEIVMDANLIRLMTSYDEQSHGFGRVWTFYGRAWWLIDISDYKPNTTRKAKLKFVSFHEDKRFDMETDFDFIGNGAETFPTGFDVLLTGNPNDVDKLPIKNR